MEKKMNVIHWPSYKSNQPFSFDRSLGNLSFILKEFRYLKDAGFTQGAILITVYKFMLISRGFLLKSKTECLNLLCF